MSAQPFVHLRVHSSFSLLEGALSVGKLAKLAGHDRMPAVAITDTNNLFAALEFSEKLKGEGIQPIVGLTLGLDCGDRAVDPRRPNLQGVKPRIAVLAASEEGYRNLMALTTRAFMDSPDPADAGVAFALLEAHAGGLIALTGGPGGPVDQAFREGQGDLARARLARLHAAFGDRLYVELQRHGLDEERAVEPDLVEEAYRLGLPLVATNQCYFASLGDYESHDALIAIAEGRILSDPERRRLTPEHRFKTQAEMVALFADLPEAVASTIEIARRCHYRPKTRKPILPTFTEEAGGVALDEAAALARQAREGLDRRLAAHGPAPGLTEKDYRDRLDFELSIIERMKFPGYFLIVSDFIKWAKAHDIPVGPGRGSGAGSLVAYALTITDLDPLRFALLFERFLNPERVSMPDFDIDFCQDRRDEVIRYVQERYGRAQVAQIITFGTLQARGVLRDVGRVLELSYGQVDKLCKLVPQNPAAPVTLDKAIEGEPKLQAARDEDPVIGRLFDVSTKLEGLNRHASTHAAGLVIGDRPLVELVPLYRDPKTDMPVTQFNMKWVEQAGLVKFDFLGLKTLTVLQKAVDLIRRRGIDIDLAAIPLDDAKTYDMLAKGETVGVFQVESAGMRKALVEMKASRFEDIIALVALYRPGPMANIPVYCARKHGLEQPEYPHPLLEQVLSETHGIIVYQEQVMQAAQILSGYSLGEADLLRRAMGKKIKAEMDKQRERFVSGCVERSIPKAKADEIFDLLAKFADYGFNKSHAAAYALVSYQTAYLKANYPVEFMAASMTLDLSNTDKLSEFRREALRLGIPVDPPSINRSGVHFDVADGHILYALAAVKGVGAQAVEAIVQARGDKPFRDLGDFAQRINPRMLNRKTLENLASAGAFDDLEPNRAAAFAAIDQVLAEAQRQAEGRALGQDELFGGSGAPLIRVPKVEPWLPAEKLDEEYKAIGFFLSGHPLDDYQAALKRLRIEPYAQFARSVRQGASAGRLAGVVTARQERRTKTGNKMGIVTFSDPSGHYEGVLFSEGLALYRDLLEPGRAVLMAVGAEVQGEDVRIRIQSVEPLDEAAVRVQKGFRVFIEDLGAVDSVAKRLPGKGDGEVSLVIRLADAASEVEVKLPGRFAVSPQIAGAIKAVPGVQAVMEL
ncbi:DNA polymerase III subunit alpha [Phreatobacter oligotrophus]|jgi:DNA polymerase III subunit alpha|uniref:DNA polymerase III subunit alpha n=1 Tax=Phreatobacter oligotrophus TaxID=1122261 RepID=UPI002353E0F3|nr:DNA polymerase III subunit alpha [Phreatobacter oligotrophus]MBX9992386.1 DNA polymerase III subunit alpha [Phreatobacter oligotrophus]